MRSNEPSTAGGRELRLEARPPASFSSMATQRIGKEFHYLKSPKICLANGERLTPTSPTEAASTR
jgi:hypothetical protein